MWGGMRDVRERQTEIETEIETEKALLFLFNLATSYPPHAGALYSMEEGETERQRDRDRERDRAGCGWTIAQVLRAVQRAAG